MVSEFFTKLSKVSLLDPLSSTYFKLLNNYLKCFVIFFFNNHKPKIYFKQIFFIIQDKFWSFCNHLAQIICILITFNNPIKACLSNKTFIVTIHTRKTHDEKKSIFPIENLLSIDWKIISVQNQIFQLWSLTWYSRKWFDYRWRKKSNEKSGLG